MSGASRIGRDETQLGSKQPSDLPSLRAIVPDETTAGAGCLILVRRSTITANHLRVSAGGGSLVTYKNHP